MAKKRAPKKAKKKPSTGRRLAPASLTDLALLESRVEDHITMVLERVKRIEAQVFPSQPTVSETPSET